MDSDDQSESTRQFNTLSMAQTLTAPLNNTTDFFVIIIYSHKKQNLLLLLFFLQGIGNDLGQTTIGYEQILDEFSRDGKLYIFFLQDNIIKIIKTNKL